MADKVAQEPLAVSVQTAVALAGVGRTKLYAALGDGSLPSLKIGARRLIRVEALKAWIAAHEAESAKGRA